MKTGDIADVWGVELGYYSAHSPILSSSLSPTSLKPTASIPACTASAMASVPFFSFAFSPRGSAVAMNSERDPALSGLPVVVSETIVLCCVFSTGECV